MTQPYGDMAMRYLAAGFSPLPLPARAKEPPPTGWTGEGRPMASGADVAEWTALKPNANIGLRLPRGVVGIDVDAWKGDAELGAWQALVSRLGPLPEAPRCSSRDDDFSGVRLFRVPDGYVAKDLGKAGEVIQHHHRYVVAPPSMHPDGGTYRWIGTTDIPTVTTLPFLPLTWQQALSAEVKVDSKWIVPGTSIDIGTAVTSGVPDDAGGQDIFLSRLAMKLCGQGLGRDEAYAVWLTVVNATATDPRRPFTEKDFDRHWRGAARKVEVTPSRSATAAGRPGRQIELTRASEIRSLSPIWGWTDDGNGRIPAGELSIAAGREGTGKSSFAIWLGSLITLGKLPGIFEGAPRAVIYVAVEDSWERQIVPRLHGAGADLSLVWRTEMHLPESTEAGTLFLPQDNRELERAIGETDAALVIIDPIMSAMGLSVDTHKNREVRTALDPLAAIAHRTGAMILGISHFSKGVGADASSLIVGSGAFKDVARAIFVFAKNKEGARVMTQTKNSYGRDDLPSYSYSMDGVTVETEDGYADVGRFTLGGVSDQSVQEVLDEAHEDGRERNEVRDWLESYLMSKGGEAPRKEIFKAGRAEHFSEDQMKRASKKLGLGSKLTKTVPATAIWYIPSTPVGAAFSTFPLTAPTAPTGADRGDEMDIYGQVVSAVGAVDGDVESTAPTGAPTGCSRHRAYGIRQGCVACELSVTT